MFYQNHPFSCVLFCPHDALAFLVPSSMHDPCLTLAKEWLAQQRVRCFSEVEHEVLNPEVEGLSLSPDKRTGS